MSGPSSFLGVLARAFDDAGVPYMLAGSFASSAHGAPRATQDIDLVIDPSFESLDRLLALLYSDRLYVDADVARATSFVAAVSSTSLTSTPAGRPISSFEKPDASVERSSIAGSL